MMVTLTAGCTDDSEFVPLAFVHLSAIKVVPPTQQGQIPIDANFCTSKIVAAHVVAHYVGEMKVDTIGVFRLPFTIPVLYGGKELDYIEFYPAVAHSGQMDYLPFYTYYNEIRLSGTTTLPSGETKEVAFRSGDTLWFDTLATIYNPLTDYPLLFEPFEPNQANIQFDTVIEWVRHDAENACTGEGYGMVRVTPDVSNVEFAPVAPNPAHEFVVTDKGKLLYLELDYKGDVDMLVNMISSYHEGEKTDKLQVMVVKATDEWTHMYINLRRTWGYFNHNSTFRLSFMALNPSGVDGAIYIDNLKLLTTSVEL